MKIQLGQLSVIPPRLVLEVGGTSTKQAAMPGELKSPPTWNLEGGGNSTLQAQLPARLKSPPLQAQVWGGSRWADLAVSIHPLLSVYSAVVLCMLISIYTWFNDLNNSPEVIRHLKDIIPQWYIAAALTLKLCECCIKDVQIPHCTHVWVCAQCSDVWWTPAILIEIYHRENKTLYWQPQAHHVLVFFRIQ